MTPQIEKHLETYKQMNQVVRDTLELIIPGWEGSGRGIADTILELGEAARKYHWIMTHMPNPVIDTINDALETSDE